MAASERYYSDGGVVIILFTKKSVFFMNSPNMRNISTGGGFVKELVR
jgi:hypothetical protein